MARAALWLAAGPGQGTPDVLPGPGTHDALARGRPHLADAQRCHICATCGGPPARYPTLTARPPRSHAAGLWRPSDTISTNDDPDLSPGTCCTGCRLRYGCVYWQYMTGVRAAAHMRMPGCPPLCSRQPTLHALPAAVAAGMVPLNPTCRIHAAKQLADCSGNFFQRGPHHVLAPLLLDALCCNCRTVDPAAACSARCPAVLWRCVLQLLRPPAGHPAVRLPGAKRRLHKPTGGQRA